MGCSVGIMQPYWIPYPGYFRLLARCDVFVVLDNVQFPRRGFVHRNKLRKSDGDLDWINLPLKKKPQKTLISDMEFHPEADALLKASMARFPVLRDGFGPIEGSMQNLQGPILPVLLSTLRTYAQLLGMSSEFVMASDFGSEAETGQDRILSIVKALRGTEYVNPPGGVSLYDEATFRQEGVKLSFLKPWEGDVASIAEQIGSGRALTELKRDVIEQSGVSN